MVKQTSAAFDHLENGTPEAVWATSTVLRSAVDHDLSRMSRLVVVAAHPDDETLGAGGLLATAARLRIPTVVLIATLGERSHPASPTHTESQLKSIRRAEVVAAVGVLDPTATIRLLGLPDGELSLHEFLLCQAISEFVADSSTVVAAPWIGDGHPDHAAAGRAAAVATRTAGATLFQYPIWAWHWGGPDDFPASLVKIELGEAEVVAKHAALQQHVSQTRPLSDRPGDEAIVGVDFGRHFQRSFEVFVVDAAPAVTLSESDGPHEPGSLGQEFFDEFYGEKPDPWGFENRWYERRKRAITMACLPRARFRNAFEPGCSIGVLTADLATRCDEILATDISERPLVTARTRLAGVPGVRFEQRRIPGEWPAGKFDLVVLSEIGYYCGPGDLRVLAARASSSLTADGVLIACHWRHQVQEYPLRGDEVHRALLAEPGLAVLAEHEEEDFLLHVLTRPEAGSVARATGLMS